MLLAIGSNRICTVVYAASCMIACGAGEAQQACLDLADAVATSSEECGVSYGDTYDAIVEELSDCAFDKLRDRGIFYGSCIPGIRGMSCETLSQPLVALPSECANQLK